MAIDSYGVGITNKQVEPCFSSVHVCVSIKGSTSRRLRICNILTSLGMLDNSRSFEKSERTAELLTCARHPICKSAIMLLSQTILLIFLSLLM